MTSCGLVYIPNDKEKAFEELLPKLFEALDNENETALYELFSADTREQCDNLQEQISALFAFYGGPTDDYNISDVPMQVSTHFEKPGTQKIADATIPVRSGEQYYFFHICLTYKHYDEKQVGITQLEFYTADEMCALRESSESMMERKGLYIHAEKDLECEIRTICLSPLRYTSREHINLDEVKEFTKGSCSFTEFVEKFGEANAKESTVSYYYYELPKENGAPRYLMVSEWEGELRSISIVDDFKFVESIWKNKDVK